MDIIAEMEACPKEIAELYEVFDKLRVAMKFENKHFFNN
jgi:hypothetical protein